MPDLLLAARAALELAVAVMTTVRVHLADAPTDVLVWLVAQPPSAWWSVDDIAAAVAPGDADNAQATTANALELLRLLGYVVRNPEIRAWAATVDGQNAVDVASGGRHA